MFGDDRDTIYKTNYADDEGTEALTNYLQHDQQAVRDRTGREMGKKDLEQFNDKAAGKRNRHIIISPRDHEELSDRELDRATRDYMSEMIEERPTADYVYSRTIPTSRSSSTITKRTIRTSSATAEPR